MDEQRLHEDEREDQRRRQATKETDFLRLKRSRLGVDDFESLKVIGRGAFGEVCLLFNMSLISSLLNEPKIVG